MTAILLSTGSFLGGGALVLVAADPAAGGGPLMIFFMSTPLLELLPEPSDTTLETWPVLGGAPSVGMVPTVPTEEPKLVTLVLLSIGV